jgi:flagellar hook-associated protein 3 FlgL
MTMRISTNTLHEQGVTNIVERQRDLLRLQEQIATGRRVVTPADDPVAAARILEVGQAQAVTRQYAENAERAADSLAMSEQTLRGVVALLQEVKASAVQAGNPSLGTEGYRILARDLRGRLQELLGLANATDGNGQYLYSGFRGSTQPFSDSGTGAVSYAGDDGQRLQQISASRQIAVSDSGSDIFQRIRTGNGSFATSFGPANSGSGVINQGTVSDPAAWGAAANPRDFTLRFDVAAGGAVTYDIVNNANGQSLLTGAPAAATGPYARSFTAGASIELRSQGAEPPFDFGATVRIDGTPADGDEFTLTQSTHQDMFRTLGDLIAALESASPAAATQLNNRLGSALANIDNALERVLAVQTSIGSRMREIESTRGINEDLDLQYSQTLSALADLDYARAISDLQLQSTFLAAAQKSFLRVQGLTLFDLL